MFSSYDRVVRCSAGHLYTTIWIPLGSLKALRLGWKRYQYCPVGHHWAMASKVDVGSISAADLSAAEAIHDLKIP